MSKDMKKPSERILELHQKIMAAAPSNVIIHNLEEAILSYLDERELSLRDRATKCTCQQYLTQGVCEHCGNPELAMHERAWNASPNAITRKAKEDRPRCDRCGSPFLDVHHRHVTRDGTYHTACYNGIFKKLEDSEQEHE